MTLKMNKKLRSVILFTVCAIFVFLSGLLITSMILVVMYAVSEGTYYSLFDMARALTMAIVSEAVDIGTKLMIMAVILLLGMMLLGLITGWIKEWAFFR